MQARLKGARALHISRPACSGAHRVQKRCLLSVQLGVNIPKDRVHQAPAADQATSGTVIGLVLWTRKHTDARPFGTRTRATHSH